jgi:hypothetical protein
MRHALLIIGLVSTLAPAETVAEPARVQAEGVSFVAPSGWAAQPENKRYLAPDVPKDESCYIAIMPTVPLKGHSPEDVFTLLQEPNEVVSDTGVLTAKTKTGHVSLSEEKVVLHGKRIWRGYYSVVQDGHLAGLLLSATTEPLFTKSMAAARALRESMQLVKAAKP